MLDVMKDLNSRLTAATYRLKEHFQKFITDNQDNPLRDMVQLHNDAQLALRAVQVLSEIVMLDPEIRGFWDPEKYKRDQVPVIDARVIRDILKQHGLMEG